MKTMTLIATIAAFALAGPALAHPTGMNHSGMMMNDPSNPYAAAEMNMQKKMMAAKGADDGETWTRKMIEHHRGAIAMSRVAMVKASDPQTRRMAQMNIAMQTKDVANLEALLKSRGKRAQ